MHGRRIRAGTDTGERQNTGQHGLYERLRKGQFYPCKSLFSILEIRCRKRAFGSFSTTSFLFLKMKNFSALLLVILLALAGQLASAQTIRRVNNTGITGINIYADLTSAQTAAANGDIIQVEPSTTAYAGFSCNKQLTIVGPGYFLAENQPPALQANVIPATVGAISFGAGSAGTTVSGLSGNTSWYIATNNITVQRCYIPGGYLYVGYGLVTNGAVIRQNYMLGVQESSPATNSLITNNIFVNGSTNIASVSSTGSQPTSGSAERKTLAPAARAISCDPRQTPSTGVPRSSRPPRYSSQSRNSPEAAKKKALKINHLAGAT